MAPEASIERDSCSYKGTRGFFHANLRLGCSYASCPSECDLSPGTWIVYVTRTNFNLNFNQFSNHDSA